MNKKLISDQELIDQEDESETEESQVPILSDENK